MTLILPCSYQTNRHENEEQHQVMEDQHPVLEEESPHCLKRVATVCTAMTFDPLSVKVAQVHCIDVVGHIGSSEQNKAIDQPVTVSGDKQPFSLN